MNISSVKKARRYSVRFLPSPPQVQNARIPKLSGRHHNTGEFELCPSSVKIWQKHDGLAYYLSYALGPLGYFLAHVIGDLKSYMDVCEIPHMSIINFRTDFSNKQIEVLGKDNRGILWKWKFSCQDIDEIVKHIGDSIKIENVEPVPAHAEQSADQPTSHLEVPKKIPATMIGMETSGGLLLDQKEDIHQNYKTIVCPTCGAPVETDSKVIALLFAAAAVFVGVVGVGVLAGIVKGSMGSGIFLLPISLVFMLFAIRLWSPMTNFQTKCEVCGNICQIERKVVGNGDYEWTVTTVGNASPVTMTRKAAPTKSVQQLLAQQRENTEMCISVLTNCRTRAEVLDGFTRAAQILKRTGDPLAEAVQKTALSASALPDEHVFRLRDDFIKDCRAFLSVTKRGV